MENTRQPWKTPVLHTRGIEETLSGVVPDAGETADYAPGDPSATS